MVCAITFQLILKFDTWLPGTKLTRFVVLRFLPRIGQYLNGGKVSWTRQGLVWYVHAHCLTMPVYGGNLLPNILANIFDQYFSFDKYLFYL